MKKINTDRVVAVYNTLSAAKITKMDDCDKFAVVKVLRKMKKTALDFEEFRKDAEEKLKGEEHDDMILKAQQWQSEGEDTTLSEEERREINRYFGKYQSDVMKCVQEEAEKEVELDFPSLSEEAFEKLVASNDWTLGVIDTVGEVLLD